MHHMVFLNPRTRGSSRRSRRLPSRGTGGRFLPRARTGSTGRRRAFRQSVINPPILMATRRRSRRSSSRRRVRRNPPKMTPAMRAKIGARIRALHRAGKYRKSRRSSGGSSPRRTRRSAARRVSFGSVRRVSRRSRRSGSRRGGAIRMGGALGLGALLSRDNLLTAGGALGATFAVNYAAAFIAPRLPSNLGSNPFVVAAIKLAVGGITAKIAARYSAPVARGVLIGTVLVVANDMIRRYALPAGSTAQYLGGNRAPISQYLGGRPAIGPVSPTGATFSQRGGMGGVYNGGGAFKGDAWSRG